MMSSTINTSDSGTNAANLGKKITENAAITKVMADISFLQDRIAEVKGHRTPNTAVLRSYSDMLARRKAALTMLLEKS